MPPAGQAAAGGPRGQALSLTKSAINRGVVDVHTALMRTILFHIGALGGAQFT